MKGPSTNETDQVARPEVGNVAEKGIGISEIKRASASELPSASREAAAMSAGTLLAGCQVSFRSLVRRQRDRAALCSLTQDMRLGNRRLQPTAVPSCTDSEPEFDDQSAWFATGRVARR